MKAFRLFLFICVLSVLDINIYAGSILPPPPFEYNGLFYQIKYSKEDTTVWVTIPNERPENWYEYYKGTVNIPSTVLYEGKSYIVKGIENQAFRGQGNLNTVIIPNTVETIDHRAFTGSGLSVVVFSANGVLKNIERQAFKSCHLTSVSIPNSVTYIGEDAFADCPLEYVKIGESVETLDNNVFQGCEVLTEITIPGSVKKIGDFAFWNCYSLLTVNLNEGLEVIGNDAFLQCSALENINIPNTVKEIGWEAFRWCINLKSIEIPNSVEKMDYGVFRYCTWLENVKLGNSLKEIPGWAFEQTPIKSIEIPNSVTHIMPYAFQLCYYLEDVKWGNSVTNIGDEAFLSTNLKKIVLPEPLHSIGGGAFAKCDSLTEVTLPRTLTTITDAAFTECHQLKTVYLHATLPPFIPYTNCPFTFCNNPVEVHVYEGYKEIYEKNIGWEQAIINNYITIIDDIPTVKATSIEIDNAPYYCEVGGEGQATATILPENAMSQALSWSSSDETILYIDKFSGRFFGLAKGVATITATTTDGSNIQSEALVYVGGNGETDILSIKDDTKQPSSIYNLQGQKLTHPTKGINIIKGKKIFVVK